MDSDPGMSLRRGMSELAIRRKAESHIRDYGVDVLAELVAGPFVER